MSSVFLPTPPNTLADINRALPRASEPSAKRQAVRTFDIFDTLIARRGIEPSAVFVKVGETAGVTNFVEIRRQAEIRVAETTGHRQNLELIYAEVGRLLGLDKPQQDRLRAAEIETEMAQVIPIAENLARVEDGDVLVSDMYLGEAVIRRLLERAGLRREVGLVVTNEGKAKGWIWPLLQENFDIVEHLGDNPHSDHAVPRSLGIPTRQTAASAPNDAENLMIGLGLPELGGLCREARLATWSEDPKVRVLQAIQVDLNFPLLIAASVALARLAGRAGLKRLAFSARDCFLWLPLFRRVAADIGVQCEATYFYTSRAARKEPSEAYLHYARDLLTPGTLVVDICGTGWSLSHLVAAAGLDRVPAFFVHRLPPIALYESAAPAPAACDFFSLVAPGATEVDNIPLEMCNTAPHPMARDVRVIADHVTPIFAPETRPAYDLAAISAQNEAFLRAVEAMDHYDLSRLYSLTDDSLAVLATTFYQQISRQPTLTDVFLKSAVHDDERTKQLAGLPE